MATAQAGPDLSSLNYTVLIPFNSSSNLDPAGGDSLTEDLNVYYQSGDIAWLLTSSALVLLMIPGVG